MEQSCYCSFLLSLTFCPKPTSDLLFNLTQGKKKDETAVIQRSLQYHNDLKMVCVSMDFVPENRAAKLMAMMGLWGWNLM